MTGQKPAAAEKNESANPVLNQSILVVTLVLTGGISTLGGSKNIVFHAENRHGSEKTRFQRIPESMGVRVAKP